jgi:hypothetical protein
MDARGNIYTGVTVEEIKAKNLVEIPADQEQAVRGMNRKQRRAWYSQQRKKVRAGG